MEPTNVQTIRFLLNGDEVTVQDVAPTLTLLAFLREHRGLTGTKEGCAEGDCGACTVVVAEPECGQLRMRAVNACIRFLPTIDGKAVFTVEYLRRISGGELHPVQQAMVQCHGSQCGFCTPGFVMSLWSLYVGAETAGALPSSQALADTLSGNLCRCTGYKPILQAGRQMFELPPVRFDRQGTLAVLNRMQRTEPLAMDNGGSGFHVPTDLSGLHACLAALRARGLKPQLLAGSTDVGLWVTKQGRSLGPIVYLGGIAELHETTVTDELIQIGAMVTLADAYSAIESHYPELHEMHLRFASLPIRHAGTLGGNVANGSPIGDSMPWLIALGSHLVLEGPSGRRTMPLEDLYTGYQSQAREDDEIVAAVTVPLPAPGLQFRTYKVAKRYDSDISAVCAAFALQLNGEQIVSARVAFGGMAATPRRATGCEACLTGARWDQTTLEQAVVALAADYQPIDDQRASAGYRIRTAGNLLRRFYLETRPVDALPAAATSVYARVEEGL